MPTLGKRIRTARGKDSQDVFSAKLGISKGSLGFYERDENLPNSDTILKICSETGVRLEWLMTGNGTMRSGEKEEGELRAQSTTNWAAEHACTRCQKLESELEQERESGRKKDEVLFDFIKRIERYMEENGELRLEVVKQRAQLETARQMCHQYAEFIKSKGLENPLFQNTEVTHFSESLPFHQAPPATSPPEHPPRHKK